MNEPQESPRFQFRLVTLMIAVTLLAIICGAIRWLFILVGTEVGIYVLVALSLVVAFVRSCSTGRWLWRKWDRRKVRREHERESDAMRRLMESAEVQEALRDAQAERLPNPTTPAGKDP